MIGGGPAGCTAAGLLAARGHAVTLLTRPVPPARWLGESIPASARKLLARVGALEAVAAAGLVPNEGNTVWWAGEPERSERFPEGVAGFHSDRGGLERVFQGLARAAGVRLRTDGPVRSAEQGPEGWRLAAGDAAYRARWVLDASGRAGVLARRGLRSRERDTATLALVGHWTVGEPESPTPHLTLVESYADGWIWSVPLSARDRCVTAMVDPRRTGLERALGLDGMLEAELAKTPRLMARMGPGRMTRPVRACPASLYGARRFGEPGLLLVGDAGSFIDPLSSYGVKKALASGWLAAIVAHTTLTDESLQAVAVEYFDAREREVYATYRARSVAFLREAAQAHRHPFWDVRLDAARVAGAAVVTDPAGDAIRAGPAYAASPRQAEGEPSDRQPGTGDAETRVGANAMRVAYEEIRSRPSVDLRRGSTLHTVERPAVVDDRIALVPHLASAALPEGARYVRDVDLGRLVRVAPGREQVPDIYEAYNACGVPADLADFLAALALAVASGLLELPGDDAWGGARAP